MGLRIRLRRGGIAATVSVCTAALLTSSPAGAQPLPPPPPIPGYPVPELFVPGNPGKPLFMQDFSQEFAPYTPPAQTDARGVFVATNANSGQTVVGMPGSRLGVVSPRIGPYAGPPGFQTQGFGPGVLIGSMGEPAAEVDPYGHRPPSSSSAAGELSPFGITANTGTALESAGVEVATMGSTAGLEDPNGQPPATPGPVGLPLLPPPQPNP
ncbi:hypothetical protein ACGFK1_26920 [Mycobacterium sp. NPDC048908]|uniref:hypothetical protein n=1 Tax=Mycobacterium sp. NPDC048908 TaxID=3364292 RepID=UPI00372154A9